MGKASAGRGDGKHVSSLRSAGVEVAGLHRKSARAVVERVRVGISTVRDVDQQCPVEVQSRAPGLRVELCWPEVGYIPGHANDGQGSGDNDVTDTETVGSGVPSSPVQIKPAGWREILRRFAESRSKSLKMSPSFCRPTNAA